MHKIDLGYRNTKGSFQRGDPFTMAFCRTEAGNYLVTGHLAKVKEYITANLGPALVSFQYVFHGQKRGRVEFCNTPKLIVTALPAARKPLPVEWRTRLDEGLDERLAGLYGLKPAKHKRYIVMNEKRKVLQVWRRIPENFPADLLVDNS